jgi:hypothetical protein
LPIESYLLRKSLFITIIEDIRAYKCEIVKRAVFLDEFCNVPTEWRRSDIMALGVDRNGRISVSPASVRTLGVNISP